MGLHSSHSRQDALRTTRPSPACSRRRSRRRRRRGSGVVVETRRLQPARRGDLALPPAVDERLRQLGVELRPCAPLELDQRRLDGQRRPVRPRRGHRVERVGDAEQPRLDRDLGSRRGRADSRSRPSARGGSRTYGSAGSKSSKLATSRAPVDRVAPRCCSSSSSVSGPGLQRRPASTEIFPTSCSEPPRWSASSPRAAPAEQPGERLRERRHAGRVARSGTGPGLRARRRRSRARTPQCPGFQGRLRFPSSSHALLRRVRTP